MTFFIKLWTEKEIKIIFLEIHKVGFTLNSLYDTTCMTHNRLSNFYGVYVIIQVVHNKFIKVVLTDYSAFRGLCQ